MEKSFTEEKNVSVILEKKKMFLLRLNIVIFPIEKTHFPLVNMNE